MHLSFLYHRGEGMKKVLITGKNSYIGTALENWLAKEPENYQVQSIDMKDGSWKQRDFSTYDVVFHVAGIAHIKETASNSELYYKVNRDLAFETAKKAKNDGVRQFIFLSSMSVYGIDIGITNQLPPLNPKNAYGNSKKESKEMLNKLIDDSFSVAILRPPIVYGKDCKGNYPRLAKLALKTPVFQKIENKRSMIYIDNLTEFIKQLIDSNSAGLFFPQNSEYVNTTEMVRLIAESHGKRVLMTKTFNPFLNLKIMKFAIFNKIFGDLVYDMSMSEIETKYRVFSFEETINRTETR